MSRAHCLVVVLFLILVAGARAGKKSIYAQSPSPSFAPPPVDQISVVQTAPSYRARVGAVAEAVAETSASLWSGGIDLVWALPRLTDTQYMRALWDDYVAPAWLLSGLLQLMACAVLVWACRHGHRTITGFFIGNEPTQGLFLKQN